MVVATPAPRPRLSSGPMRCPVQDAPFAAWLEGNTAASWGVEAGLT
jgi:hypothetical protein